MIRSLRPVALAALALGACDRDRAALDPCAHAQGDGVVVADAWVRPAPAGGTTAVYATICNLGPDDDALTGGSAAASAVELHASSRDAEGVARMAPLDRLAAPAGGTASLAPGAAHLMLVGLAAPVEPGATVTIAFRFEKAGEIAVEAEARSGAEDHSVH